MHPISGTRTILLEMTISIYNHVVYKWIKYTGSCTSHSLTFSLESRTNTLTSPASNSTSSFAPWFSIVCAPGGTFLNPRNPPTMGTSFPLQTMTSFQMSLSTNQAAVYKVIQRWITNQTRVYIKYMSCNSELPNKNVCIRQHKEGINKQTDSINFNKICLKYVKIN